MPPVWSGKHLRRQLPLSRRSHQPLQWRLSGGLHPLSLHYICIDQWYQFESEFSHNRVFSVVT